MKAPRILQIGAVVGLMAHVLSGCGSGLDFIAPEIEPPSDLIPGYVPDGFELVSGFELQGGIARVDGEVDGEGTRGPFPLGLVGPLEAVSSPAGNAVQGIEYSNGDALLLITKSSFPGGNLDLWRRIIQPSGSFASEACTCASQLLLPNLHRVQAVQIVEEREVDGVRVAIVDGLLGSRIVFVRGEDLLTVEGGISQEEALKVVASLLP